VRSRGLFETLEWTEVRVRFKQYVTEVLNFILNVGRLLITFFLGLFGFFKSGDTILRLSVSFSRFLLLYKQTLTACRTFLERHLVRDGFDTGSVEVTPLVTFIITWIEWRWWWLFVNRLTKGALTVYKFGEGYPSTMKLICRLFRNLIAELTFLSRVLKNLRFKICRLML